MKWNQTKVRRPIRAATVSRAYCYPTACGTGYHSGPNGQRAAECRKFKWQFVVQCLILFSSYVWSAHHFSISKLLVWCSNDKVLKKTRGQCTARFFLRTLQGYRGGCSWSPNCLGKRMLASFFNPKKDARINSTWEKWWEMPWLLLTVLTAAPWLETASLRSTRTVYTEGYPSRPNGTWRTACHGEVQGKIRTIMDTQRCIGLVPELFNDYWNRLCPLWID